MQSHSSQVKWHGILDFHKYPPSIHRTMSASWPPLPLQSICCYILAIWYPEDVFIVLQLVKEKNMSNANQCTDGSYILVFNHLKRAKGEQNISTDCFNKHTSGIKVGTVILLLDIRQNDSYTNIYSYHKPSYKHSRRDWSTDHLKKLHVKVVTDQQCGNQTLSTNLLSPLNGPATVGKII